VKRRRSKDKMRGSEAIAMAAAVGLWGWWLWRRRRAAAGGARGATPAAAGASAPASAIVIAAPLTSSGGSYTVAAGNSLSQIARDVMGNMSRWPELAAANGISAPFVIFPGQVLTLPA